MERPVSVDAAFDSLTFLADRTPVTEAEGGDYFAELATYRDGGVFVAHYGANSEWERHPADETPDGVKVWTVTPQPTDHQVGRPS